jgi:4-aminobutyrate aminotransferase
MPLGAMIARKSLMTWPAGTHASTFGGNPVSCAAALVTLRLLEDGMMDNAAAMGAYIDGEAAGHPDAPSGNCGTCAGRGLMVGIEDYQRPIRT